VKGVEGGRLAKISGLELTEPPQPALLSEPATGEQLKRVDSERLKPNERLFIRHGKGLVRDGLSLVRDGNSFVRDAKSLVRDGKGFV